MNLLSNVLDKFKEIHTFIFDVDGVLTNSQVVVFENGELVRLMNTRDGYAMKKAIEQGYRIAIITSGRSKGVILRLQGLGITDIYAGIDRKIDAFEEFMLTYHLDADGILYMGDDIPDFEVMERIGLPTCPADATSEILNISDYISPYKGGDGCVRDVIEKVMKLQKKW
jgi:3-deoxy-D-manno-octulosonate 8-phosphate phosphatase (KDO 8-P phosphatase)